MVFVCELLWFIAIFWGFIKLLILIVGDGVAGEGEAGGWNRLGVSGERRSFVVLAADYSDVAPEAPFGAEDTAAYYG